MANTAIGTAREMVDILQHPAGLRENGELLGRLADLVLQFIELDGAEHGATLGDNKSEHCSCGGSCCRNGKGL